MHAVSTVRLCGTVPGTVVPLKLMNTSLPVFLRAQYGDTIASCAAPYYPESDCMAAAHYSSVKYTAARVYWECNWYIIIQIIKVWMYGTLRIWPELRHTCILSLYLWLVRMVTLRFSCLTSISQTTRLDNASTPLHRSLYEQCMPGLIVMSEGLTFRYCPCARLTGQGSTWSMDCAPAS